MKTLCWEQCEAAFQRTTLWLFIIEHLRPQFAKNGMFPQGERHKDVLKRMKMSISCTKHGIFL